MRGVTQLELRLVVEATVYPRAGVVQVGVHAPISQPKCLARRTCVTDRNRGHAAREQGPTCVGDTRLPLTDLLDDPLPAVIVGFEAPDVEAQPGAL
jgi:hypothetical protein